MYRLRHILFAEDSFEEALFKVPEELELAKDEAVDQKKDIIDRQDKDKV